MARGEIVELRGTYGFIRPEEGRGRVFFHRNVLEDVMFNELREGMAVEYESELGDRGPRATTVRLSDGLDETDGDFLNPYNFVRYLDQPRPQGHVLGDCPPPPHDRYIGLTGRIVCELTAVTPLFVSDSHAVQGKPGEHRTFRFFQVENEDGKLEPALPATSLRGMVRSVFEAATNSCFGVFDNRTLSYRLDSRRAPWLVPARVETDESGWHLRLLNGATPLQIEDPCLKNPKGMQYAAWLASYRPIKPSKTLRGIDPRGRRLNQSQKKKRQHFIDRTSKRRRNPDGLPHGSECYALLRCFQHPHPRVVFWDVVEVRRKKEDLPLPKGNDERVERGWLCITNQNIETKHSERFFFHDSNDTFQFPETIELSKSVRDDYEELIADYQDRHAEEVRKRRSRNLPVAERARVRDRKRQIKVEPDFSRFIYDGSERKLQGGELVYAMLNGTPENPTVQFIAPVSVPRVGYQYSLGDLLSSVPHARHCSRYAALCPACRVFGWVHEDASKLGKKERVAYAGRVRFSHGKLLHSAGTVDDLQEGITLAILSTPKPTTTQFYLLDRNGQPSGKVDYDKPNARLRGRKFYRHHGAEPSRHANGYEYERAGGVRDDQNRTVCGVLEKGTTFEFSVDFENLAPVELGALLWSLEMEKGMHHRLGYARPLGFGSVTVRITTLKVLQPIRRFSSLKNEGWAIVTEKQRDDWIKSFQSQMAAKYDLPFDELPNIRDLRALSGEPDMTQIHYPRLESEPQVDGENFRWFVENKRQSRPHALGLASDDRGLPRNL